MANDLGNILGSIAKGSGTTVNIVIIILVIIFVVGVIIAGISLFFWNKKRYNIRVEIKKVRSDGKVVSGEWAKGLYSAKRGAMFIKRNKIRKSIPVKVFDIRKYLQGEDLLTVIQVAPEDFRPVLCESYTSYITEYEDEDTGKIIKVKEAILNIKVDSGLNKPWKSSFENASKRAYSLVSLIQQFQTPIAIGIVIICCFVGFAIMWTKLGSVCGG